jgi:diadenosine tetraphosphate (Ap4A) HIT family hydrolase
MSYDEGNIFRRILDGKISTEFLVKSRHAVVIRDINPQAPFHYLLIPKGNYRNLNDFLRNASTVERDDFFQLLEKLTNNAQGSRIISNIGAFGKQEVDHLHIHILRDEPLKVE